MNYDEKIKNILKIFKSNWNLRSIFDPANFKWDVIYHYTSSAGLFGILSSGILRATNFSYLNDSSELIYGSKLVEEVIDILIKGNTHNFKNDFLKEFKKYFSESIKLTDLYIACFSKVGDYLNNWRAYGPSSGRFSIGFSNDYFNEKNKKNYRWDNVHYETKYQKKQINKIFNKALTHIDELESIIHQNNLGQVLGQFYPYLKDKLMNEICFFKDTRFADEEEVRAACWITDRKEVINDIKFYQNDNDIKPCIDLIIGESRNDFPPKLPIFEIYVGPSGNQGQLLKTAELMLVKFGYYNEVEIKKSNIPLR